MIVIPVDAQLLFVWSNLFVGMAMAHDLDARSSVERADSARLALAVISVTLAAVAGLSIEA
jgi:hypothetical protein